MADIDIQRNEGRGPWPWLIGVVALALIVWAAWEYMGDDTQDFAATTEAEEQVTPAEPMQPATTTSPADESAGERFLAWVRDSAQDAQQMGREHEYTRDGLDRLTAALEGLFAGDTAPQIRQHLETLREQRLGLAQSDASSTEHAAQIERAFEAAVNALEQLSERPQLQQAQLQQHVDAARNALGSLDANRPLLEQRDVVHQFFDRMAQAIQAANRQLNA